MVVVQRALIASIDHFLQCPAVRGGLLAGTHDVDIAKAYLEENAVWGTPSPIEFVREYLSNEVNFDPLTATWLFLQDELACTELANGLAARISLMVASWPQIMDASQVSRGPVVESLPVGGVPH